MVCFAGDLIPFRHRLRTTDGIWDVLRVTRHKHNRISVVSPELVHIFYADDIVQIEIVCPSGPFEPMSLVPVPAA